MPVIYDAPPVTGETVRSPYEVIEQGIPLPALPLKKRKRGESGTEYDHSIIYSLSANTQLKYALQQQLHSSQLVRDFHQITTNEDSGDELYDPEEDNYVEAGLVDSGEEPTKRLAFNLNPLQLLGSSALTNANTATKCLTAHRVILVIKRNTSRGIWRTWKKKRSRSKEDLVPLTRERSGRVRYVV
jgi:hypothetical protein